MFEYIYDTSFGLSISMRDNVSEVAFIKYGFKQDSLYIKNIERTLYADRNYNSSYHFGTEILNELLLYLQKNKTTFTSITGKLTSDDAQNFNWIKSIPFYANFSEFLNSSLKYRLEFHLYDDISCKKEIILSTNIIERRFEIENFRLSHLSAENNDAYFKFNLSSINL